MVDFAAGAYLLIFLSASKFKNQKGDSPLSKGKRDLKGNAAQFLLHKRDKVSSTASISKKTKHFITELLAQLTHPLLPEKNGLSLADVFFLKSLKPS